MAPEGLTAGLPVNPSFWMILDSQGHPEGFRLRE